jgi:hypothetical protein
MSQMSERNLTQSVTSNIGGTKRSEATADSSLKANKKAKLNDKQKAAVLLDLYQKTKLDRLEIFAQE